MHRPVELRLLGNSKSLICLGENPLIVIPQPEGSFDITGFSLSSVHSCGTLGSACPAPDDTAATSRRRSARKASRLNFFFSQTENRLYTGVHSDITRTSHTPTHVRHTVTLVTYVPNWNGFVFVARQKQCDTLQFFASASLENTVMGSSFALDTRFSHFLDNERCVFIEPIILGGPNTEDLRRSAVPPSDDYVVLVGSSFTFPDEQTSRNGRLSWYRLCSTMGASRGGRTLERVGDTDIEGPLLSCCMVPSYKGRIALGICGCIFVYNYNAIDRTFIPEEKCRIGVTLTKLLPVFPNTDGSIRSSDATTATTPDSRSSIIAFDARCSAIVVTVDAVQGTLVVSGRDAKLRGIVDGISLDNHTTLCCSDDSLNLYVMGYEGRRARRAAGSPIPSHVTDRGNPNPNGEADEEEAEGKEDKGACRRLVVLDEYHVGDLITTMRTGSFAPISLDTSGTNGPLANAFARNIDGAQIVFGTAYGAFGSVTPVNMVTYIFLKALEEAIVGSGCINGVYGHSSFRRVLCVGQELDALSNRSFRKQPRREQQEFQVGVGRHPPTGFCDGDRVRDFLSLSRLRREEVLRATETALLTRLQVYVASDGAASSTVRRAAGTAEAGSAANDRSSAPAAAVAPESLESSAFVKLCNKHLGACALPRIPLNEQEVASCVTDIKKYF
ncbi:damage-specific DNA binding protein [Strigomonas culicis]|uniref:Damage-specific DNA binding protein n=1 Tax=Strigomonas culicis TaxID=28005 RepID=S9V834_9TRYP|nr:damage-specific DNA binding protein [Strigomonas culicis]|eukprot:EPY37219.1 damage-specific DNA binding protein [Strigomonas culicis]